VNSTDDSTNVMRFGIDDTNLRTILTCIYVQTTYTCTSIYDIVISNDSDVTDEVNSTDDSTSVMRFGIDDTNLRTILTCIYVRTTYTCTSIYDIVISNDSDVTDEVNSTDDSTNVMRFGIDDTNLRTIDLYICPNNVYMHQYI